MGALIDPEITLCGHPGCDEAGTLTDRHGAACPAHVDRDTAVDQVAAGLLPDDDSRRPGPGMDEAYDELGLALLEAGAAVLEEVHAEMRTPDGRRRTAELLARLGLSDAPDFVPGEE